MFMYSLLLFLFCVIFKWLRLIGISRQIVVVFAYATLAIRGWGDPVSWFVTKITVNSQTLVGLGYSNSNNLSSLDARVDMNWLQSQPVGYHVDQFQKNMSTKGKGRLRHHFAL